MRGILLLALLLSCWVSLSMGPVRTEGLDAIVLELRLPRVCAAIVVGAGLALSGTGMQALLRNPLADPYILGLSSGASLGVVAVFVSDATVPLPLAASLGAGLTAALVFAVARDASGLIPGTRLVLSGVAVTAVLSSMTAFLIQTAPREAAVRAALYFGAGGFGGASLLQVGITAVIVVLVLVLGLAFAWALDRLLLGEEVAESLGVAVARLKLGLFGSTTLLTGALVALAGPIGFVGLVAPHIARLIVGPKHQRMAPTAALVGALLVLWADTLGRTAFSPREVPAGLFTAVLGGPFFLWLIQRRSYGFGGRA